MSMGGQVLRLGSDSVGDRIDKYLVRGCLSQSARKVWLTSLGLPNILPSIEKNTFGQQGAD